MACPIQTQMDDVLHRMSSDTPPSRDEIDRLLVIAARHTAMRLDEGAGIMRESVVSLNEQRGALLSMQGELGELRITVMTKHAQEIDALKAGQRALEERLESAKNAVRYWAAGAAAVVLLVSKLNLQALGQLLQ